MLVEVVMELIGDCHIDLLTYNEFGISNKLWTADLGFILHMNRGIDIGFVAKDALGSGDFDLSPSVEAGFLYKECVN